MARLDINVLGESGEACGFLDHGPLHVHVTLSRRNLLALLHKLDMEGSEPTLRNDYCYVDGEDAEGEVRLWLHAEDDAEHYANRDTPAGLMHPETEKFIFERNAGVSDPGHS